MSDRWLPRTPLEVLIKVDAMLADVVPRFGGARERVAELLPGHSGRPAGNGEPGGGSGGGHGDTVVERLVLSEANRRSPAAAALADLDRLVERIVGHAVDLAAVAVAGGAPIPRLGPLDNGAVRPLVWVRWLIRGVAESGRRGLIRPRLRDTDVGSLYNDAARLAAAVDAWAEPRQADVRRTDELAADDTERWCRSCLRIGWRSERAARYQLLGLCRWCGDFHAEQGFLPSLELLDAHRSGKMITTAMVAASRPTSKSPKRKKRRR